MVLLTDSLSAVLNGERVNFDESNHTILPSFPRGFNTFNINILLILRLGLKILVSVLKENQHFI